MPVFQYKAQREDQTLIRGTETGDSARDVRDKLRNDGLVVIELVPHKTADTSKTTRKSTGWQLPRNRQWPQFVATFTGDLSTLLAVGVPLLESLDTLIKQYSGVYANSLMVLRDRVVRGQSLAEAMKQQPAVYDILCTSMVEVGENTGNLDEVLGQLSHFKRRSLEFRDRLIGAILYPMIVLTVSMMVTVFLMTIVVPMLLQNLLDAGRPLPWPTRLLKAGSELLLTHGWWLGIVLVTATVLAVMFLRTSPGKSIWYSCLLRIPILGDVSRKQEISRVALVVATLLKSGVEFLNAIEIAGRTTKNVLLIHALERCRQSINEGRDVGDVMGEQSFFPPMVVQVFSVGQSSGRLGEMLFRLAEDYDSQVQSASNRLSAVLEPLLIVGLSLFVGFILFATLLPILEAGNVLN